MTFDFLLPLLVDKSNVKWTAYYMQYYALREMSTKLIICILQDNYGISIYIACMAYIAMFNKSS